MGGMRRFLTSCRVPARTGLGLRLTVAAAAAALLAGCSSHSTKTSDPYKIGLLPTADVVAKGRTAGHWTKDGMALQLVGTVTPGSAAEFNALVGAGGLNAKTVRATVTGGDLAEGLAIGRVIHDRKLDLQIDGVCAGPCADYWFPAAANRKDVSGSWLGYVPDLSTSSSATAQQQAAEAKLYADSGVDATKFHTALSDQLREIPGGNMTPAAPMWMPNKGDLRTLGYPDSAVQDLWLPPNLASANAQARAWGQVVAYRNTLIGQATAPVPAQPAPSPAVAPPRTSSSSSKR